MLIVNYFPSEVAVSTSFKIIVVDKYIFALNMCKYMFVGFKLSNVY